MTRVFLLFLSLGIWVSCSSQSEVKYTNSDTVKIAEPSKYPRMVGDIAYDSALDDPQFKICNDDVFKQYFNFVKGAVYIDEKPSLVKKFKAEYQPVKSDQSGLLRVRFIVNCEGQAGRFRLLMMDNNYNPTEFADDIVNQILSIVKKQERWALLPNENNPENYYQYLIFKIREGKIIEILP